MCCVLFCLLSNVMFAVCCCLLACVVLMLFVVCVLLARFRCLFVAR